MTGLKKFTVTYSSQEWAIDCNVSFGSKAESFTFWLGENSWTLASSCCGAQLINADETLRPRSPKEASLTSAYCLSCYSPTNHFMTGRNELKKKAPLEVSIKTLEEWLLSAVALNPFVSYIMAHELYQYFEEVWASHFEEFYSSDGETLTIADERAAWLLLEARCEELNSAPPD